MRNGYMRALCGALVVLAAAVALAGVTEPRRVLELRQGPNNPRNSEGDFARLKNGDILYVYSHYTRGTGGDHDPAQLTSRVSKDGGRTWSKEDVVVVENEGGMNVMSVSTLRLKDGSLALFYLRKNSNRDCRPMMRVSKDEGKTWSPSVCCVPDSQKGYYVLNNCRVTRLASGRIVLPLAAPPGNSLVCYFSDDDGRTWKRGKDCFLTYTAQRKYVIAQEPGVVELKDGRVLMYARTSEGRQWYYYSSDGCDTWTRGEPGPLWSPRSPATIKRLSNGDLLAVWNDHENRPELLAAWEKSRQPKGLGGHGPRTPLTLAISRDEGKTWINRHVLEGNPKGWFCYTAVLELDDGRLLLGYCAMDGLKHSRITEVPLAWLYDASTAKGTAGFFAE